MKTIVAVARAQLVLAGCAKAAPEIKPYDPIDVDAWRASLVNLGASRTADMESLYASSEGDLYINTEVAALGEINPGNSTEMKVAFGVPPGTPGAQLQRHDSMFSDGVKVALA